MYYTNIYLEARERLTDVLSNNTITVSTYGERVASHYKVDSFFIDEEDYETQYANITLIIRYLIPTSTEVLTKDRKLRLLANMGDVSNTVWTERLKQLVFEGTYPDTIAIDVDSGELFLVTVYNQGVHIRLFNTIPEQDLEMILENLEEREPYSIKIDERATYEVLDGSEGYKHLYRNIQVVLRANVDYTVYSHLII